MAVFSKKILPESFEAILSGKKKCELRLNDFDIKEGDTLKLEEYTQDRVATGRMLERKVSHVGKLDINNLHWPTQVILDKGLQIISLE